MRCIGSAIRFAGIEARDVAVVPPNEHNALTDREDAMPAFSESNSDIRFIAVVQIEITGPTSVLQNADQKVNQVIHVIHVLG